MIKFIWIYSFLMLFIWCCPVEARTLSYPNEHDKNVEIVLDRAENAKLLQYFFKTFTGHKGFPKSEQLLTPDLKVFGEDQCLEIAMIKKYFKDENDFNITLLLVCRSEPDKEGKYVDSYYKFHLYKDVEGSKKITLDWKEYINTECMMDVINYNRWFANTYKPREYTLMTHCLSVQEKSGKTIYPNTQLLMDK